MSYTNNVLYPNFADPNVTADVGTPSAITGPPYAVYQQTTTRASVWMRVWEGLCWPLQWRRRLWAF